MTHLVMATQFWLASFDHNCSTLCDTDCITKDERSISCCHSWSRLVWRFRR